MTIDRHVIEEIRRRADNLSQYVNEALADKLYFARAEEEAGRLEAEGFKVEPRALEWLTEQARATDRRLARRRAREASR